MIKLNVPYYKQDTEYTCGPAVIRMLFSFWGIQQDQDRLEILLGTSEEKGTLRESMIQLVRQNKFNVHIKKHSDLESIKYHLDKSRPVVVNNIDIEKKDGHYVLIAGYEDGNLLVHDPWTGPYEKREERDFMSRWSERDRWMMVIESGP